MKSHLFAFLGLALALSSGEARAGPQTFSGSLFNTNSAPLPDPSCSAGTVLLQFNPGNSVQNNQSNFGGFGNSQSHCIGGFPFASWVNGSFLWTFDAGDTLFGTTSGNLAPTASPGLFDTTFSFVVGGGTGRFLDASGILKAIGSIDTRRPPTVASATFSGVLDLPAVPEPESWALFIAGAGLAGATLRIRRREMLPA